MHQPFDSKRFLDLNDLKTKYYVRFKKTENICTTSV